MTKFSESGLALFVFAIIFTVLCGAFIALRFLAARIARRQLYLDDGFVVFSYMNMIALAGVGLWACVNGIGFSAAVLTPDEIVVNAKLVLVSDICWLLGSVFAKLSILWLYQRIFATKVFKMWARGLMGLTCCYGIALLVVFLTNCEPVDQLWNPHPDGHCRDMQYSDYATIGINLVLDICILILPLPTLWGLRMPTKKKALVTCMLSFGLATIAVMLYRIGITIRDREDPDFTKHLATVGLVSGLEVWFGIIIACVPTLGPLFKQASFKSQYSPGKTSEASRSMQMNSVKNGTRSSRYEEITSTSQSRLHPEPYDGFQDLDFGVRTDVAHDLEAQYPRAVLNAGKIHVRDDIELRH